MFIAVLFAIAKAWNQPKRPSVCYGLNVCVAPLPSAKELDMTQWLNNNKNIPNLYVKALPSKVMLQEMGSLGGIRFRWGMRIEPPWWD